MNEMCGTATASKQTVQSILPDAVRSIEACDQLVSKLHRSLLGPEPMTDQPACKTPVEPEGQSILDQLIRLTAASSHLNSRLTDLAESTGDL